MKAGIDEMATSIRAARQAKALTQKELGQRVGLPQSHISKIEKGAVDLQLSSLVEIARALDLEVKLIPRKALAAVEGAVRAHGTTVETSRALNLLNEHAQLAERIKDSFPEISQIEAFQNAIRNIPKLQFDAAQVKALNEAFRPAKHLKSLPLAQEDAAKVARLLEKAISSLKHFRRVQVNAPLIDTGRQLPAYRLDENDE
ncbi:helix-turn-helix transcriptional regulator [Novosphingobium sp. MMS21-SN21R]|uniref:helix-turn-helix domain-containing protein n=1 Tax=Novosphingobium sp. MMS21-SN21R TaxID=2969298 RepID=UPI0028868301|nr:helix-turn-helix transcriptional regulator [Novosphingobium sp. MMS21-SN21R]MDT0507178.1 helix-turn-helix transcriptional regulator [Novosphingobium sp. MMS21-SN21R]